MPNAKWSDHWSGVDGRQQGRAYGQEAGRGGQESTVPDNRKALNSDEIAKGRRMIQAWRGGSILYRDEINSIKRLFEACIGTVSPTAEELVSFATSAHVPGHLFFAEEPLLYESLVEDVDTKRRGHLLSPCEIDLLNRLLRVSEHQRDKGRPKDSTKLQRIWIGLEMELIAYVGLEGLLSEREKQVRSIEYGFLGASMAERDRQPASIGGEAGKDAEDPNPRLESFLQYLALLRDLRGTLRAARYRDLPQGDDPQISSAQLEELVSELVPWAFSRDREESQKQYIHFLEKLGFDMEELVEMEAFLAGGQTT